MVCSFENVSEDMWSAAVEMLRGKLDGTRILVWINFDLIALQKIFYLVEKGVGRVVCRDYPLPTFWDEELSSAGHRLERLQQAIDSFTFSDLPPFAVSNMDDDWDTWGVESNRDSDDALSDASIVESLVTEDSLSTIDSESVDELSKEEAMERIQQQFSLYREED